MSQELNKQRSLTMGEIRQVFSEMGLASRREREKMLKCGQPVPEQGENAIVWIDSSTDTTAWQLPSEEQNAELE